MDIAKPSINETEGLRARLETELRLADDLGLTDVAIDINQAIEKLSALLRGDSYR